MSAITSSFFSPTNPKRPANFVVFKYFLLGLLISNSIESILIIPKILDVLDQNKMQVHEIEEVKVKRAEVASFIAERKAEVKELKKELEEKRLNAKEERQLEEKIEQIDRDEHVEVRRKPQKKDTGTNPVAVFMLFYGAVTLCLGIVGIFRELPLLIAILIGVSFLGIVVLVSAGFSLIMLLSVSKDCIIACLAYKVRDMIVSSDLLVAGELAQAGPAVDEYSQQQFVQQ